jgi:hypothetical protein
VRTGQFATLPRLRRTKALRSAAAGHDERGVGRTPIPGDRTDASSNLAGSGRYGSFGKSEQYASDAKLPVTVRSRSVGEFRSCGIENRLPRFAQFRRKNEVGPRVEDHLQTRHRSKYLRALRSADAGDPGPLGEMLARSVMDNLYRFVVPAVAGPNRLVPLAALADNSITEGALRVAANRGRLRAQKAQDGQWRSTRAWTDEYISTRHRRS